MHPKDGQCSECGLPVATSMSVAACRVRDPESLESIRLGMGMQVWGTLIALAVCICGPLIWDGTISFAAFGIVVTFTLGLWSAWLLFKKLRQSMRKVEGSRLAAAAIGSWSIVIPALALRMATPGNHLQTALLAFLLVGAIFWFVSECSKLHLLEQWAVMAAGMDVRQRARNLRWGVYAAVGTIAAGLIPPAVMGVGSVNYLAMPFVLMVCVSLLVLSLLGVMLQGKLTVALEQQVKIVEQERSRKPSDDFADEPNWVIWPHPPRWSSF